MDIKIKKEYEVSMPRFVKEGLVLRISPSYGCIDIPSGLIQVIKVGSEEEINESSYDFDSWRHGSDDPQHWIKYKYQDANDGSWDILPLEEFIAHTSRA